MDDGLDPYLEAVDRDLAQSEMGGILPGGGAVAPGSGGPRRRRRRCDQLRGPRRRTSRG